MAAAASLIITCGCSACALLCARNMPGIWMPGQLSAFTDEELAACEVNFALVRAGQDGHTHSFFMALRPGVASGGVGCRFLGKAGCELQQIEECHLPVLARQGDIDHKTRPIECATTRSWGCRSLLPACEGVAVDTEKAMMLWCSPQGIAVMRRYAAAKHTTVAQLANERMEKLSRARSIPVVDIWAAQGAA